MGQRKVYALPWMPAPLPEVCDPIWKENKKTRSVCESKCKDIRRLKI
jgi:hypothetical protein